MMHALPGDVLVIKNVHARFTYTRGPRWADVDREIIGGARALVIACDVEQPIWFFCVIDGCLGWILVDDIDTVECWSC